MSKQVKISPKLKTFIALHTQRGNEIRYTKNGHPYAVIRANKVSKARAN